MRTAQARCGWCRDSQLSQLDYIVALHRRVVTIAVGVVTTLIAGLALTGMWSLDRSR